MTPRVLLTDSIHASGEELLRAHGAEVVLAPDGTADTVRGLARSCDAVILRSRLPDDIFASAPRLRAATVHGTGTDLVPLDEATRHGVAVANLPGGNAQSVAEYCVMAMLMLARRVSVITQAMRNEPWDQARARGATTREIAGLTVGVIGVGAIGRRVAAICRDGFGMRVLGHQRRLDRLPEGVEAVSLDDLLAAADFVIVSCPLNKQTHHLLNAARLAALRPGAWLVSVGRGAVIDEDALVEALRARRFAGAMLDVYEHYRLAAGDRLYGLDNVVLTPHLAGMTLESRARMSVLAAEDTLRMLAGDAPRHLVNPEVWSRFRERRPQDR